MCERCSSALAGETQGEQVLAGAAFQAVFLNPRAGTGAVAQIPVRCDLDSCAVGCRQSFDKAGRGE